MAVFTTIAGAVGGFLASVAGGYLGSTLIGTAVAYAAGWIVAGGLAIATANLLGVFDVPDLGPDPGVKIQVAPNTDNRIGVAFGKNFMSGPIIDVAITNQNNTMQYCIALSEYVEGATYTVNQIFFNDAKLIFPTSGANTHKVSSYIDSNATTTQDWADKIRIRVYAGSTNSADQIFPSAGTPVNATTMMSHWNVFGPTHYTMENLVFAMIELDYDAENGLTGLGAMSFDITNSIHNPGEVLHKYLNNSQWGAGLSNTFIDTTSILGTSNASMKGYCDEQISYTPNTGGSTFIDRWQINGYLNTADPVLDNIDRICKNSNIFFTYDGKQGKFKTVPNRQIPASEQANAFVLNDDNIVSKLNVSSTELFSLYNSVKVEFQDKNRKDQMNSVIVETPASERNSGEPDNELVYRAALMNNNIHAEQIANINLNQSRYGMVVTCEGDFSTLQIDAGDVVKLTNSVYGFTDKLFWVVRSRENFTPEGMITCAMTLLEYNNDVYIEAAVTETDEEDDPTDIPSQNTGTGGTNNNLPPPGYLSNYFFNVTQSSTSGSGVGAIFTIRANTQTTAYEDVFVASGGSGYVTGETITVLGTKLRGRTPLNDCTFQVAGVTGGVIPVGVFNATQNITGNALLRGNATVYGNIIDKDMITKYASGGQVDVAPASNTNLASNTAVFSNVAPTVQVDLANTENGKYTVLTNGTPLGELPSTGAADYGMRFGIDVKFANNTVINNYVSQGVGLQNFQHIPSVINSQGEFEVTDDMVSANIRLEAYNTLAEVGGTPNTVGFKNLKYDMMKVNKGDLD